MSIERHLYQQTSFLRQDAAILARNLALVGPQCGTLSRQRLRKARELVDAAVALIDEARRETLAPTVIDHAPPSVRQPTNVYSTAPRA